MSWNFNHTLGIRSFPELRRPREFRDRAVFDLCAAFQAHSEPIYPGIHRLYNEKLGKNEDIL
jgi:hypothetical protein